MLLALVFALAAIVANAPADEFSQPLLADCTPHVEWNVFVGCEKGDPSQDETDYAGLIWVDGQPALQTGP